MTPYEREIHICWNDEDKTASIYCSSIAAKRELDRLVEDYPETYIKVSDDGYEGHYYVDSKYIRFRKPASERTRQHSKDVGVKYGFKSADNESPGSERNLSSNFALNLM